MARRVRLDWRAYRDRWHTDPEGKAFCNLCGLPWPGSMCRIQEGILVGPNCYEPGGWKAERDKKRAQAAQKAAQKDAKARKPPKYSGYVDDIFRYRTGVLTGWSPADLTIARGNSETLSIAGYYFDGTESWTTDDAEVTLTPTMVDANNYSIGIAVGASAALGFHFIELDGEQKYRKVYRVT